MPGYAQVAQYQHHKNFIESHSDVTFTHGVCDSCMQKNFPEVAQILINETDAERESAH